MNHAAAQAIPLVGKNRTGMLRAPERAEQMTHPPDPAPGDSEEAKDDSGLALMRETVAKEAEPVGTMPVPRNHPLEGQQPSEVDDPNVLLLDKLGERMAFERTGVRLYEGLLLKFDVHGSFAGGPEQVDLIEILEDEKLHFTRLHAAITELGGDPTVITPSADLAALVSSGVVAAIADPRTTLVQGLEAVLVAELSDNACWHALAELTMAAGLEGLAGFCHEALLAESTHLARVQRWLAAAQGRPAPSELAPISTIGVTKVAAAKRARASTADGKKKTAERATPARKKSAATAKPAAKRPAARR